MKIFSWMIIGFFAIASTSMAAKVESCSSSNITQCMNDQFKSNLIDILKEKVGTKYEPQETEDILEVWKLFTKDYSGGMVRVYFKTPDKKAVGMAICDHDKISNWNFYKKDGYQKNSSLACFHVDIYQNDGDGPFGEGGKKIGRY